MPSDFDLTTLRNLKVELCREIQQVAAHTGPSAASGGITVMSWSRASISHYSEELERLEAKSGPTTEDKQIMQELNQVTLLLDELVALSTEQGISAPTPEAPDLTTEELPKHIKPRLTAPKIGGTGSASYTSKRKDPNAPKLRQPGDTSFKGVVYSEPLTPLATPATPHVLTRTASGPSVELTEKTTAEDPPVLSTMPATSSAVTTSEPSPGTSSDSEESMSDDEDFDPRDPKGVYEMLGVSPDVPFPDLKRAVRRMQVQLHPDRNPEDPEAATRFTEFDALVRETVIDEETRRAYDNIQTVEELKQLTNRVRMLTMDGKQ